MVLFVLYGRFQRGSITRIDDSEVERMHIISDEPCRSSSRELSRSKRADLKGLPNPIRLQGSHGAPYANNHQPLIEHWRWVLNVQDRCFQNQNQTPKSFEVETCICFSKKWTGNGTCDMTFKCAWRSNSLFKSNTRMAPFTGTDVISLMSRKCWKLFCETFANGFHGMKRLCAGMTRAAIKQNKKVSFLAPVFKPSFVVAEHSYLLNWFLLISWICAQFSSK